MPIDWQNAEVKDRILAAVIAAAGTINVREVARMFGDGATYNAIENFLRSPKKLAKELKEKAQDNLPPSPARGPKSAEKQKTGGSAAGTVKKGRVKKSAPRSKNGKKSQNPNFIPLQQSPLAAADPQIKVEDDDEDSEAFRQAKLADSYIARGYSYSNPPPGFKSIRQRFMGDTTDPQNPFRHGYTFVVDDGNDYV